MQSLFFGANSPLEIKNKEFGLLTWYSPLTISMGMNDLLMDGILPPVFLIATNISPDQNEFWQKTNHCYHGRSHGVDWGGHVHPTFLRGSGLLPWINLRPPSSVFV